MKASVWERIPERGSIGALRLALWLLNTCGYGVARLVAYPVALYFFLTGTISRRASMDYLRRLHLKFPESVGRPGLWKSYLHHLNFAFNILDRLWLWQGEVGRFRFSGHGLDYLKPGDGKGGLLIGAHIGSFDAMRLSVDKRYKINVVLYRANARKFNQLLKLLNPRAEINVIEIDPEDFHSAFQIQERIEAGEMVALLGDRPTPMGKQRNAWISFLGEPAPFPQSCWVLAGLLGCPVYLTVGVRTGRLRYRFFAEPIADRVVLPRGNREAALRGYMEKYVRRLEQVCAQYPYQWFNFFDVWNKPAADAASEGKP